MDAASWADFAPRPRGSWRTLPSSTAGMAGEALAVVEPPTGRGVPHDIEHAANQEDTMKAPISSPRTILRATLLASLLALGACAPAHQQVASVPPPPPPAPSPAMKEFEATAYSIEGKTASGGQAREGICAADPKVLPLGSRIRVLDAGQYSGEYVVTDTGRTIDGHEIDIYLANDAEAKRFGRKKVRVEVISSAK